MSIRTRIAAGASSIALVAGLTAAGIGAADAAPSSERGFPMTRCIGLSPNIIDYPFDVTGVTVSQYDGFTQIRTGFFSWWLGVGYDSVARLDWQHLDNKKRGTLFTNASARPPAAGVLGFNFPRNEPGKGRVKITLSAVNRNALWAIPATSCTGTVVIP